MWAKYKIPLLTIFAVLFIDQFIKIYIKLNYPIGIVAKASNWCMLLFTENAGMAFGFEFGGGYGKLILSLFRIIACVGGAFYIIHIVKKSEHAGFVFAVSLILAGAIGNILDSMFYGLLFGQSNDMQTAQFLPAGGGYAKFLYGHVVDMFYFPIINGHFPNWLPIWGGEEFQFFRPIFNFADFSISLGVGIIIVFQKRFGKQHLKPIKNETALKTESENQIAPNNNEFNLPH
ncbi:MAG: lipoprotein signal peptidase [Bacteroidetes bacterium]|nr:lipoprotein signal peptidase [Bacteroidota bacterium]